MLEADALMFATDRWLLGPENVAAVWLKRGAAAAGCRWPARS